MDYYEIGADDASPEEVQQSKTRAASLSAVPAKGSSKTAWAIGIGLAAFVGLPVLINSLTDLVRASKE